MMKQHKRIPIPTRGSRCGDARSVRSLIGNDSESCPRVSPSCLGHVRARGRLGGGGGFAQVDDPESGARYWFNYASGNVRWAAPSQLAVTDDPHDKQRVLKAVKPKTKDELYAEKRAVSDRINAEEAEKRAKAVSDLEQQNEWPATDAYVAHTLTQYVEVLREAGLNERDRA